MNRRLKYGVAIAALLGAVAIAYAFTVPTSVESYNGSGAGSTTQIYNLDGGGNVTITGGLTINGKLASTTDGSFGASGVTPVTLNTLLALQSATSTQINAIVPTVKGEVAFCNSCVAANGGKGILCMSTATVTGSWIIEGSSLTAVTSCQ